MMPMLDVQAFILVGGRSTRMGTDKAQLTFGNRTSVELIAASLAAVARSVTTVGSTAQSDQTIKNIPDLQVEWGPLAGIEAALRHATATHALIVACDFPFITTELLEHLLLAIDDADAIVPLQPDGYAQPLCAAYRVSTCLIAAEAAIAAGQHSPRALLQRIRTLYVPFRELAMLPQSDHFFFNVNTPDNYQEAQQIFNERVC